MPGVLKFQGLITTFEMIMADCPDLRKLHWRCVVIDEAHRLKNRNCKLLEGLKLMNLVSRGLQDLQDHGSVFWRTCWVPSKMLVFILYVLNSNRNTRFC